LFFKLPLVFFSFVSNYICFFIAISTKGLMIRLSLIKLLIDRMAGHALVDRIGG
jgi:hypothetical protein